MRQHHGPGRGTLDKEKPPILGLLQRGGEVVVRKLTDVQQATIRPIIEATVTRGALLVSDGLFCRPAVAKAGCSHFTMVTGSGKRAVCWTPFQWVNSCLDNVKAAIVGTYNHVSAKHTQSYLTSFAYRFNRCQRLDSIVERCAWARHPHHPTALSRRHRGCM